MKLWFKKSKHAASDDKRAELSTTTQITVPDEVDSPAADSAAIPPAATEPVASAPAAPTTAAPPQPSARTLFNQLLNGLYDAAVITDLKGHIVNANQRLTTALGFDSDDIWDWPINRLIPGISNTILNQINAGLEGERYVLLEARCNRKDDSTFPAEIAISHVAITADNNLLFCIRNIERRHATIRMLQAAERLLNHQSSAALSCDQHGNIIVANRAIARMLGVDKRELLIGQPFANIWREPQAPNVIKRALEGETIKEPATIINVLGKRLQIVISLAPDIDSHKRVVGFLVCFTPAAVVSLGRTAKLQPVSP